MGVIRYLHTAILVSDLEKAELFYSDVLELPKAERSLKFQGVWYQVGDYQIHLIENQNWKPLEPNPDKWGRCPHLALAVDHLERIKADLTAKGYPFQESSSGRAALFTVNQSESHPFETDGRGCRRNQVPTTALRQSSESTPHESFDRLRNRRTRNARPLYLLE